MLYVVLDYVENMQNIPHPIFLVRSETFYSFYLYAIPALSEAEVSITAQDIILNKVIEKNVRIIADESEILIKDFGIAV